MKVKPLLPKKISLEVEEFLQRRLAELTQTVDGAQAAAAAVEQVEDYQELRAEYVRRLLDADKKEKWLKKGKVFQDLYDLGGEFMEDFGPQWTISQFYEIIPKIREKWKGPKDALSVFIMWIEDRRALTELTHSLEAARQGGRIGVSD